MVFIPHRFFSMRMVDRILALVDGKVEASGTHEELVSRPPRLFELQAIPFSLLAPARPLSPVYGLYERMTGERLQVPLSHDEFDAPQYAMDDAICRALEIARWMCVVAGFACAGQFGNNATEQLQLLAPWLIGGLAGLTGIEGIFFGAAAARLSGYSPSAYQRQSGFNNLALALTAFVAFALNWGPAANMALLFTLLIFLSLSAGNHLWSAIREGNWKARSFMRPAATLALVLVTLPFLMRALLALPG